MAWGWAQQADRHGSLPFDATDPNVGKPLAESGIVPGWFWAWSLDVVGSDIISLQCLLGNEPPRPTRGYGGWGQLERRGRRALSRYDGTETPAIEVGLILENEVVHTADGAEGKMRRLERLAGGWGNKAPRLQWVANLPHHDYTAAPGNIWVCESLEWGDLVFTDRASLIRAEATVTFALFSDPEVPGVTTVESAFPRRELRKGWDLRDFAKHYLGDAKRWKDVAELNRDNVKCPQSPTYKPPRPVWLLVPPREVAKRR